jgi:hypothetical protein
MGGPQGLTVRGGEEENFAPTGNQASVVYPVASYFIDWAIFFCSLQRIVYYTNNTSVLCHHRHKFV